MSCNQVGGRNPATRAGVHHPDLERVAIQPAVGLDQSLPPLDPRVASNGAAAPSKSAGPRNPRFEPFLIGLLEHPLEASPVPGLELAQGLALSHKPSSWFN